MKKLFTFILFLILGNFVQAQVSFEANVSKTKLGINERLRIDFEMNNDGDNFKPPSFDGFRVVGGPNQAISNSYFNGKRTYSKTYSYFLSPLKQGKFVIDQATIEIEGEEYKTSPITIEVTAAVKLNSDGENLDYLADESVHLVAEVSNTNPFLNEAITVVYKMYVSRDVSIQSSWREVNTPKYADFWSQNIDNQGNFKIYNGKYKGEDYRYVILRTTVLYPQKTGKLKIEPLTLDVPIDIPGNKRDIFGRRLMNRVNKVISAGERTINVKPLPTNDRPDDFNGAVGNYQFEVSANKTTLDASESLELKIAVKGTGNLKLFDPPKIKLPSSLEVYEPERKENVRTNQNGMTGEIAENYTIVPAYKGNYPIRSINFSFFDPRTEKYITLSSDDIIINVLEGPVNNESTTPVSETNKPFEFTKDQFKYIKLNPNLTAINRPHFFKTPLFWSLIGGPLLLIPIFIFAGRKRKQRLNDLAGTRSRKANKLARKYLYEAKKNLNNKTAFYDSLERALHNYLKAKLAIETSEMDKSTISTLLLKRNVSKETVSQFINLLESCEYARYSPATDVTMQQDYTNSINIISNIDKQIA